MFDVIFSDIGVFGVCGCNLRSLGCYSKLNRLGMVMGRGGVGMNTNGGGWSFEDLVVVLWL